MKERYACSARAVQPSVGFRSLRFALLCSCGLSLWLPLALGQTSAGWQSNDIGSPALAGTATVAGGVTTVSGSGAGIGGINFEHVAQNRDDMPYTIFGYADSFQFYSQRLTGDGQIVARITGVNGSSSAQAGLMVRAGLGASDFNVASYASPGGGFYASYRAGPYQFPWETNQTKLVVYRPSGVSLPVWVKLVRANGGVLSYTSSDGVNWSELAWRTVALPADAYFGLGVSSHQNSSAITATFDNVSVGPLTAPVPPPVPATSLVVTSSGLDYASFSWANSTSLYERLELQRSIDGTTFTAVTTWKTDAIAPGSTATDNTLAPATNYSFRLAVIRGTQASYSNTVTVTTPTITLSLGETWSTRVNVSWVCAAPPKSGFRVEYTTGGPNLFYENRVVVAPSARSCSIDFLEPNTTYYIRVGGDSASWPAAGYSNTIVVKTSSTPPPNSPAPPGNLRMAFFDSAGVHLAWDDNSNNETSFIVEFSREGLYWGQPYGDGGSVPANTTTFALLAYAGYDAPNYYRVRAVNANGASDFAKATVVVPFIQAPSGLVATARSSRQIDLSWVDNSNNETAFEVERSRGGSDPFVRLVALPANTTQYSDLSVSASSTYSYRVRATAGIIASPAYTSPAFATTPAGDPLPVDTAPPTVATFVGDSGYMPRASFTLIFSEPVTGVTPQQFEATGADGLTAVGAPTVSPTGTDGSSYRIFVDFTGPAGNMSLKFASTATAAIKDVAGNALAGPLPTALSRVQVGVLNLTLPTPGNYATGTNLDFVMTFNDRVNVTGVPSLPFDVGTFDQHTTKQATYRSGTGTNALLFRYTVEAADVDKDGITVSVLNLNGGTITSNTAGSPVIPGASVPTSTGILLNSTTPAPDTTPPTVSAFRVPTNPTRPNPGTSNTFTMELEFSEPVTGVDVSDFTVTTTGAVVAAIDSIIPDLAVTGPSMPPGQRYGVVVRWDGGGGSLLATIKPAGTGIVDLSGNALVQGSKSTGEITIPLGPGLSIASTQSATGTQNVPFTYQIVSTGALAYGLHFLSAPLPPGLSLDSQRGIISGTPTVVGVTTLGIRISDSGGSTTGNVVITINPAPAGSAPTISSPLAASMATGAAFSYTITASNSPTSFTAANLPAGLTFSSPTISGSVATVGSYNITLGAANAFGSDSKTLVLTVTASSGGGGGTTTPPPSTTPPPVSTLPPPTSTPPPPTTTKVAQTITFNSPVSAIMIGQPITLGASSSAGLPITYSIVSGDATLEGNVLTPRSAATLIVRASSAGSDTVAATSTDVNFGNPQKAAQAIALAAISDTTAASGPFTLPATTNMGLPITYSVSGPARLQGNTLILTGAAGTVTLRATAAGNELYTPATDITRTFAVRAVGQQIYLGNVGPDTFAVAIAADNSKGMFVTRFSASGEAVVAKFKLNADGSFSVGSFSSLATSTRETNTPAVEALVARTLSGIVTNGVVTGSIAELGTNFTASVQPASGATASLAGIYTASIPRSASGDTYVVVGPTGQTYAVAITPFGVTSGTGTISSSGAFNITTASGGAIAGSVNAADGTIRGTFTQGNTTAALAGLSEATDRSDRIINLSSRLRTSAEASRAMIAGFVVSGTEPKQMLVRAIGPSLAAFGVQSALSNPRLQIYRNGGVLVAENEDWANNADVAAVADRVGAFKLDPASRDAAILATLEPGAYTAQVISNGGTGVALIEVYDAASASAGPAARQLVNLSTRGFVDTGDGALIAGFVVSGNAPKRMLIRGIGPSLTGFGVPDAVANPTLKLYAAGSTAIIAQNDDWSVAQPLSAAQSAATAAEIVAAATAAGAFPLATNSRDAAIIITLMPGAYTAVVSGSTEASNATGAGLIEVYDLDAR